MASRKSLPHGVPTWIDPAMEVYFITICCKERGRKQLTLPGIAVGLIESVQHRCELGQWNPLLFLLMPDHCHALISFPPTGGIEKTIADWKRWTVRRFKINWQVDFFEHRLRKEASLTEKAEYILENPVRAGYVESVEDWPHKWVAEPKAWTRMAR